MSEDSESKSIEPIVIIIFAIATVLIVFGFAIYYLHIDVRGGLLGSFMNALLKLTTWTQV